MTASQPTIIATSIGFQPEGRDDWDFRPGHGTELHEAITEKGGALAYEIRRKGDSAIETPLPTRVL